MGERLALGEWFQLLEDHALINPTVTRRDALLCFKRSTPAVISQHKNWRDAVSLYFAPSFLEALGRVAELILIPTRAEMAEVSHTFTQVKDAPPNGTQIVMSCPGRETHECATFFF